MRQGALQRAKKWDWEGRTEGCVGEAGRRGAAGGGGGIIACLGVSQLCILHFIEPIKTYPPKFDSGLQKTWGE